ncbi:MAG: hypothetical protein NXI24_01675 [bacterium]|nr:hypothetical protein [bacterium]
MNRGRGRHRQSRTSTIVCLLAVHLLLQCAVFRDVGQSATPPDVQEHRFGNIVYEMVNWENQNADNDAGEILLATLGSSASFAGFVPGVGARDWFVQIVLEPTPGKRELGAPVLDRPALFVVQQINGIAFGQSFFMIPKVIHLKRTVKFVVWRRGELQKEYVYESDAWVLVGWLTLLLAVPSESAYLRYDMSRVARSFVADAARDGLLAPGDAD